MRIIWYQIIKLLVLKSNQLLLLLQCIPVGYAFNFPVMKI